MIFNNSSGAALPDLTDPASPNDVTSGKEYIDSNGEKQTGASGYYKLLQAVSVVDTSPATIDLVPEDFNGITTLGTQCFAWFNNFPGSPLRSVILPGRIRFRGTSGSQDGRSQFVHQGNMKFFIFENGYTDDIRLATFSGCNKLQLLIFSKELRAITDIGLNGHTAMKSYVFPKKSVVPMGKSSSITINKNIYVPDSDEDGNDLVAAYKSATNWSTTGIAEYIFGFSSAPSYNSETEYSVGDVCKYNNRFYAYYKIENSTGNAPSGTAEHTPYWWYCGDCGGVING